MKLKDELNETLQNAVKGILAEKVYPKELESILEKNFVAEVDFPAIETLIDIIVKMREKFDRFVLDELSIYNWEATESRADKLREFFHDCEHVALHKL